MPIFIDLKRATSNDVPRDKSKVTSRDMSVDNTNAPKGKDLLKEYQSDLPKQTSTKTIHAAQHYSRQGRRSIIKTHTQADFSIGQASSNKVTNRCASKNSAHEIETVSSQPSQMLSKIASNAGHVVH